MATTNVRAKYCVPCAVVLCASCLVVDRASAQDTPSQVPSVAAPSETRPASDGIFSPNVTRHSIVGDLFAPLGSDFRRMGADRNWLVAGIGISAAATAHSWDAKVSSATWPAGS